jgi:hypothetical protein
MYNLKNYVLICLLFFSEFGFSQKSNSVEFFANPIFQRFGDMTKQYTKDEWKVRVFILYGPYTNRSLQAEKQVLNQNNNY